MIDWSQSIILAKMVLFGTKKKLYCTLPYGVLFLNGTSSSSVIRCLQSSVELEPKDMLGMLVFFQLDIVFTSK